MIHYHPHCIAGRVEQLFPDKKAPLAQLAEQVTLNHWVSGSIPERCTSFRLRAFARWSI